MTNQNQTNWIDLLIKSKENTTWYKEAENHLRRLWLELQADRKAARDSLWQMITESCELREAARKQLGSLGFVPYSDIDYLVTDALNNAFGRIDTKKWDIPSSKQGLFLPYLLSKTEIEINKNIKTQVPDLNEDQSQQGPSKQTKRVFIWVAAALQQPGLSTGLPGEREKQFEEDDQW